MVNSLLIVPVQSKLPTSGGSSAEHVKHYDVVIVGGSTAAIAAAFAAAEEGVSTALLEPTDWIGGQLTASGVPAIDEAWHQIKDNKTGEILLDVARIARDPRNITPFFRDALAKIGNPGKGWVSRYCFEPKRLLKEALLPQEQRLADYLTVYRSTVIKRVAFDSKNRQIIGITAIQRTSSKPEKLSGYERPLSKDLPDWYSPVNSPRFKKRILKFSSSIERPTLFIDATEWGELLALANAPYLIGVDDTIADDVQEHSSIPPYGQAITFGFVQKYHATPIKNHPKQAKVKNLGFGSYRDKQDAWRRIWAYRRLFAVNEEPTPGDLTLQNWGYDPKTGESGNDYPNAYLFLSKQATRQQTSDWRGGIHLQVLADAEKQAFAWHDWFRKAAPVGINPDCIALDREVLGTKHGLSKVPYLRDTRRSIGLDNFLIQASDLHGVAENRTGTRFVDRVALGAYASDLHPMAGKKYAKSSEAENPTLPFYIPYRALTNRGYDNLMVAGKTMAQTFAANSATRLHPIEWSSGCAAGVSAAYLVKSRKTTRQGLESIPQIQPLVKKYTPIDWQMN